MYDRELKNQKGNGTTLPGGDQAANASDSDQSRLGKIAHGSGPDEYLAHMQRLGGPVSHRQAARGTAPAHAARDTNGPASRSMGAYEYATGKASPGGTTNTASGQMSAYEYATSEASRDGAAASDRGIAVPNVVQDAQLGPDWTAHRFVFMAADRATKSLPQVRSGDQMPAAALTALAQPIAAATEALKRVWLEHRAPMMGNETQIQAWAKTEYELDRLLAVVLQLQMMASATPRDRGLGSAAPSAAPLASNVLELEAAAALLGYRPPGTLADAQARVAVACPPGSEKTDNPHCEVDQTTRQGRINGIQPQLAVLLTVFFDACTKQESTLEAMIEHDAKWAEIVVDVFAGALVATGAGALAGGAVAAGAEAAGAEASVSKGAEILRDSLREAAKGAVGELADEGGHAAEGDPRSRTLDALEALKVIMTNAVVGFPYERLAVLDDDALGLLSDQIGSATGRMRDAVAGFVAAYRQQVEPLDTHDHTDPRMNGMFPSADVETRAVWIAIPGRPPRLAVVKAVAHVTLGNVARSLAARPVPFDEVDFVSWVEPRLVPVAAQHAHGTIRIDQVKNLPAENT